MGSIFGPNYIVIPKTRTSFSTRPSRSSLNKSYSIIPNNTRTSSSTPASSDSKSKHDDVVVKLQNEQRLLLLNNNNNSFSSFLPLPKFTLDQQALFLFTFIASTASVSFISLVIAAVPTLLAIRRTAISLSKLADTARDQLPTTMAAIRLSTLEITDLTLELTHLSQEITDGINKSTQAVQAAEAGVRQLGSLARQQTMSMIEERASLPNISIQPVVAGAAKKTSRAVGQATKTLLNIISTSRGGGGEDGNPIDRIES